MKTIKCSHRSTLNKKENAMKIKHFQKYPFLHIRCSHCLFAFSIDVIPLLRTVHDIIPFTIVVHHIFPALFILTVSMVCHNIAKLWYVPILFFFAMFPGMELWGIMGGSCPPKCPDDTPLAA